MPGYGNRVIHLNFDELSESFDPAVFTAGGIQVDPIWVSMRNPRLMPPGELSPDDVELDAQGQPVKPEDASNSMYRIFAKLIIGWSAYDSSDFQIDPATGHPLPQAKLPLPATPELVKKLPTVIINRIAEEMTAAANPQ